MQNNKILKLLGYSALVYFTTPMTCSFTMMVLSSITRSYIGNGTADIYRKGKRISEYQQTPFEKRLIQTGHYPWLIVSYQHTISQPKLIGEMLLMTTTAIPLSLHHIIKTTFE